MVSIVFAILFSSFFHKTFLFRYLLVLTLYIHFLFQNTIKMSESYTKYYSDKVLKEVNKNITVEAVNTAALCVSKVSNGETEIIDDVKSVIGQFAKPDTPKMLYANLMRDITKKAIGKRREFAERCVKQIEAWILQAAEECKFSTTIDMHELIFYNSTSESEIYGLHQSFFGDEDENILYSVPNHCDLICSALMDVLKENGYKVRKNNKYNTTIEIEW